MSHDLDIWLDEWLQQIYFSDVWMCKDPDMTKNGALKIY